MFTDLNLKSLIRGDQQEWLGCVMMRFGRA